MEVALLDYGPVVLRMPFGFRLAADTLPSGCPRGQNPTVGTSPWLYPSFPTSCPFRVRHGHVPQPTRHYPRLWIRRPSSGRPRDLNPPDQDTAQHTLRTRPPPQMARPVPRGRPVAGRSPAPPGASRVASDLLFGHAAANTPVGPLGRIARGTAYSNRFPLTQRRRPSPELWRVGSHITAFGACSAFTTRCGLPDRGATLWPFPSKAPAASLPPPPLRLLPAGATQVPGGDCTHGRPAPYHGAHSPPEPCCRGGWSTPYDAGREAAKQTEAGGQRGRAPPVGTIQRGPLTARRDGHEMIVTSPPSTQCSQVGDPARQHQGQRPAGHPADPDDHAGALRLLRQVASREGRRGCWVGRPAGPPTWWTNGCTRSPPGAASSRAKGMSRRRSNARAIASPRGSALKRWSDRRRQAGAVVRLPTEPDGVEKAVVTSQCSSGGAWRTREYAREGHHEPTQALGLLAEVHDAEESAR